MRFRCEARNQARYQAHEELVVVSAAIFHQELLPFGAGGEQLLDCALVGRAGPVNELAERIGELSLDPGQAALNGVLALPVEHGRAPGTLEHVIALAGAELPKL